MSEPTGPLKGLRVIEMGQLLAGPFVGSRLADFGAEVIKIETPGKGDPMRLWGHHRFEGETLWWPTLARNKKSLTVNLREARGQEIVRRLLADADGLVENFRPGTLERWGLGPERLQADNPGLIVVRVSGYGQTGPYADRPGFASVGEHHAQYLRSWGEMLQQSSRVLGTCITEAPEIAARRRRRQHNK